MILLDGKTLAEKKLQELKEKVSHLSFSPNLDIVLVGNDPASLKYIALKQKQATTAGIGGQLYRLPETATPEELLSLIAALNQNSRTTAFFIQLPLPNITDPSSFLNKISLQKDADGLTASNLGLLFQKSPEAVAPATALGILSLLDEYQIDLDKKRVVIVNDSPIVGLPLFALLNSRQATVTLCHRHTASLADYTRQAEILISATGVKNLITADMVSVGVVALDVGGGDIEFETISKKASYLTPTFGGVGPMTVVSLLENTYLLATRK